MKSCGPLMRAVAPKHSKISLRLNFSGMSIMTPKFGISSYVGDLPSDVITSFSKIGTAPYEITRSTASAGRGCPARRPARETPGSPQPPVGVVTGLSHWLFPPVLYQHFAQHRLVPLSAVFRRRKVAPVVAHHISWFAYRFRLCLRTHRLVVETNRHQTSHFGGHVHT